MPENSKKTPVEQAPEQTPATEKQWNWERLHRLRDGLPWPFVTHVRENRKQLKITAFTLLGISLVSLIALAIAWQSFLYADPQLEPELAELRGEFQENPRDEELAAQIRALDFAQRQNYWNRQQELDLFGWAALLSGALGLLYLKGWVDAGRKAPGLRKVPGYSPSAIEEEPDAATPAPKSTTAPAAEAAEEPRDPEFVDQLMAKHGHEASALIPILNSIQARYRYLPEPMIQLVEEKLGLSRAHIDGVISFYLQFRLKPCGKSLVKVCVGTACHVAGASRIIDQLKRRFDIPEDGDTAPDRSVTIEEVACIGCCMLAPAADLDGEILGPTDSNAIAASALKPKTDKAGAAPLTSVNGTNGQHAAHQRSIALCLCSSCRASGSAKVATALQDEIKRRSLPLKLEFTSCEGESYRSPLVHIREMGVETARYQNVTPEQVRPLLRTIFPPRAGIEQVTFWSSDLVARLSGAQTTLPQSLESPGGEATERPRIAASNASKADPVLLDEYKRDGGFRALHKAANQMDSRAIIDVLKESGLRGRGGAGFPTGIKWEHVLNANNNPLIICNGDEGDPGAFMDRMLMESFPFRVLEGMAIAARTTGAKEGILYIRAEYPLAIERIEKAIRDCEEAGILGDKLLGTNHPFHVRVVSGAGAFVCGEETALLASLEGERGEPRQRPPYPAIKGAWGRSTLINNVESYCNIPWILLRGAEAFKKASASPERSGGTKTFALAGKINRPGLIEVPVGTTIREIVYEIGGGVKDGKALKAVQIGGPSGGCVPAEMIDTPIDYDTLAASGSMMGSGGMVVLSEEDCMVDVARYFMEFATRESCGKCAPCRIGTTRMLEILTKLCAGEGSQKDLKELEQLAQLTQSASLCGLGKTAPNPLLSTLKHFREEYEAHVKGTCPSGVCTNLIRYAITDTCIGCTLCSTNCPVDAIPFEPHAVHTIDQEKCIRCDSCRVVCPEDAVAIMTGETTVRGGTGKDKKTLVPA